MHADDWRSLAVDRLSADVLTASGIEYRLVDAGDTPAFDAYLQAEMRGFLAEEQTDEQLGPIRDILASRRLAAVYDPDALDPSMPVGTINSWVTELTMPGRRGIPMWAISGVTVAATHRRKGIARAMLEGELRTAVDAGVAIAGLTVSEATIYGRFGFSPAAFVTDWSIDTTRARWIGPRPDGRLDAVARERFADELAALHERVRLSRPGEVEGWPGLWRRMAGMSPGQDDARKIRAVRYADAGGTTRGVAVYRLTDEGNDFTKHALQVHYLLSETPDAYAALWRFVLEHDLVSVVKASPRSIDEPVRWMIADQRAATVEAREHQWLRVLDVPAVLSTRAYAAAGEVTLRVTDPLGFADGSWHVAIGAAGAAEVSESDADPDVTLTVGALSSIVLGGVRAATLQRAGLVNAPAATATALDACFASSDTPYLSLWY